MKQILEFIKQFFSRSGGRKLLPSIIVRSGLPRVYKPTIAWEKPKNLLNRLVDRLKSFFRGKRLWVFFVGILFYISCIFAVPYILRQPQTYQHVVKGVHAQGQLSASELNSALDMEHRNILNGVIAEALRKPTAREQIRALQGIGRISFEYPRYARIVDVFKDMNMYLFYILKTTVNVFDQLLPSVNILHNYFYLLESLATGENKKVFRKLHSLFRSSLLGVARELYGEAEFYRQKGLTDEAYNRILIAQGLLYRLKETNPEAKKLYMELDAHQQVPFVKEVQKMSVMAIGGPP